MSDDVPRFMQRALNGEVLPEEIDDFIDEWHEAEGPEELHEFLGMSFEEYSLWVQNPEFLSLILSARHRGQPVRQAVNDNFLASTRLAARSDKSDKLAQLKQWVEQQR